MTVAELIVVLAALAPVHDGHGRGIPRPSGFPQVIAKAALEQGDVDARMLAAEFDILAAHESGYDTSARGDVHDGVAHSCGAWQTPCVETPGFARCIEGDDCRRGWRFTPSSTIALEQARVARKWILWSNARCPDHPLSLYASGTICGRVRVADRYWAEVRSELEVTP